MNTPILDALIEAGHIEIVDGTYVGIASDGERLNIGVTHMPGLAERYLTDYPTPEVW